MRSYVLVFAFIMFINCFGFPVYNLNKTWPFSITAVNALMSPCCAVAIGGSLAALFPEKHFGFIAFLTFALTGLGLGCRFLLEFGEVSNTYNFTFPNIVLHVVVFVGLCSMSWLYAVKRKREE